MPALILTFVVAVHALGVRAEVVAGQLTVSAFYDDDTPARDAKVQVFAAREVAAGRTDADGRWSTPAPPPGRYEIVVDAGAGHRAETDLVIPGGEQPATAGAEREQFTRFPTAKVLLGLALIGVLFGGWRIVRRRVSAKPV